MNRGKYLIKNTLIFALGNLGTKLITFFLVPLYTAVLTTEQYGTIDFVFTICGFLVPIIILNINEAIMRFCLDQDSDKNKIMSIGLVVLSFSVFLAVIFGFLVFLYPPTRAYFIYIYFYAILYGLENILFGYLRGKELLLNYSLANILQTFLIAVLNICFLLYLDMGVKGYFLAFIISFVVTSVYAFYAGDVSEVMSNFCFDKALFWNMTKYSVVLIPNSFMWWVMSSSDRVMLMSMIGTGVTGLYAVANKLPQIISVTASVFNQAFSYSAIREDRSEDRVWFNNSIFDNLLFGISSVCIFICLILRPFMSLYVTQEYYAAWKYAPPLIIGTGILALATFMSSQYTVHKDSKGYLYSASVGAVINIVLNTILIPKYTAMGAAIATCISYITVFIYRYFDTKKYLKYDVFSLKHIASYSLLLFSGFVVYWENNVSYIVVLSLFVINVCVFRSNLKQLFSTIVARLRKGSFK